MVEQGISVESVLESVVRITEQRSRDNLEHCLVGTLIDLANFRMVGIARPQPRGDTILIECMARAEQGKGLVSETPCSVLTEQPLMAQAWETGLETTETVNGLRRVCLPIQDHNGAIAAFLVVESCAALEQHLPVVRAYAAVYRNYLAILSDAERDTLTGLKNRKTFDDKISRIIAQSRHDGPDRDADRRHHADDAHHWLGICDIDHFKRVNDTFGHVFGDEVLLLFATLMRKVFRADDLMFRFGGEEFVVVLAPTTAAMAAKAYERFRSTVEAFNFPQVGRVTASIGFVRIHPTDIPSTVVGQADEALYWAKNHGRNQVCRYEDLVNQGAIVPAATSDDAELF
jgi:diguanylate cyclase (GGDEF)-like protein